MTNRSQLSAPAVHENAAGALSLLGSSLRTLPLTLPLPRLVLLLCALLVIACPYAGGQTFYGTIVGSVTDTTGAMVPNATVSLRNVGSGDMRTMSSDPKGFYQFGNLLPGTYAMTVSEAGFKEVVRSSIVVEVDQTDRIDVALQPGSVDQKVVVTAETPLLQPETVSLGQVVDAREVNQLPLNGRNPLNLAAVVPGVIPQGNSSGSPVGANGGGWGNYQIGGGMGGQSSMYIDGAPLNYGFYNMVAYVPVQDVVSEFKVETSDLSADFGRTAGGVMNFITKSGTNDLHASVYEFLRNKVLNANTFFDNRTGLSRPPFTQNQFGFTVGGPVEIPHLYNGHSKTLFFGSYEGYRLRQGESILVSVPTQAMRQGNFTGLPTIYDPLTTCGYYGNAACAMDAQGNPIITRQPFANNIIPTDRLNPTALAATNLWALPNLPGTVNNFSTNASTGGNSNTFTVRVDQNISERQRLFARYTFWQIAGIGVDPYKTGVCQDTCGDKDHVHQAVVGYNITLSPKTLFDVRLSFLQNLNYRTPKSLGFDLTTFGLPSTLNSEVALRTYPDFVVSGYSDFFSSGGLSSSNRSVGENFDIAPKLTTNFGRHTVDIGADLLLLRHNYVQYSNPSGMFNFDNLFTSQNPLVTSNTGFAFASYLLGTATSGSAGTPAATASQMKYAAVFAEDSFRATNNLTLTLGVRYDSEKPWTERHDRISYWDPTATTTLTGSTSVPLVGAPELVATSARHSRAGFNTDDLQFGPHIGAAYRINSQTDVRAGYRLYWLPNDVDWPMDPANDFVNDTNTQFVGTLNGDITPYNLISNPFPQGILQPPGRNAAALQAAAPGQNLTTDSPHDPWAYAQQWDLDVQRQLPGTVLFDVAYAGSKGTHLPFGSYYADQLPDADLSMGSALNAQVANPFYGAITSGALSAPTVSRGQLLRPFPQYDGLSLVGGDLGSSIYHSLQAKVEKRFGGGNTLLAAYTWSKLISNTDTIISWVETAGAAGVQDWNNLAGESSLASFDVPQRLVISYVLDLPFGRGRRYLNVTNPAGKLISGWGLDGVTTFQGGFPLFLTNSPNQTNSYGGGSRPNFNASACPRGRGQPGSAVARLNEWFDTSCFTAPAPYTFGNESRTDPKLRMQGIDNFDFALFKDTSIRDRATVQFRAEFFNLFNRVQFGAPGMILGTPQFGIVSSQVNNPRLIQFGLRLNY